MWLRYSPQWKIRDKRKYIVSLEGQVKIDMMNGKRYGQEMLTKFYELIKSSYFQSSQVIPNRVFYSQVIPVKSNFLVESSGSHVKFSVSQVFSPREFLRIIEKGRVLASCMICHEIVMLLISQVEACFRCVG